MEQTCQNYAIGISTCTGFFCGIDTMLANGKETFYLSIAATDQLKGMCDVFNIHLGHIRICWVKMFSCISSNITHNILDETGIDTHVF